jgi:hypothetical protein
MGKDQVNIQYYAGETVQKQNIHDGPNRDAGNNNKNPNGTTKTTTFNKE